jgi:predicted aminopeptidase
VRLFAQNRLGLDPSSNYTRFFDTQGQPVSWNVSASPATHFKAYQWNFPVVGLVPYKGFFDKSRALKEYSQLKSQGLDVLLRPVSAYSTLGFFSDPILSTMMAYSPARLADLILHELTHATVYIKDQTDFNESLATFIGETGSLLFLAEHFGEDSPLILVTHQLRADEQRFRSFMTQVVSQFDSLYALNLPENQVLNERQNLFKEAQDHYKKIRPNFHSSNYDGFLSWEINNARLLSYKRYNRNLERFATVYDKKKKRLDLAMQVFIACGYKPDPWACVADSGYAPPTPIRNPSMDQTSKPEP